MTTKIIIVLCGTSKSGKTTYRNSIKNKYTIINSDTIRLQLTGTTALTNKENEVWSIFNSQKKLALSKEENIILDACHITPQARWHAIQDTNGYIKICILFDISLKTIKERTKEKWAIDMWKIFNRSKPNKIELLREGFDKVVIIKDK